MHRRAVDFELHALAHVRRTRLERGAGEDAAVAVGLALEAQREVEILVLLLRLQIAVVLGHALSVDGPVFNLPLLVADLVPLGKVFAVEQNFPLLVGLLPLAGLAQSECGSGEEHD